MSRGGSRYGAGRPAHNIKAESVQRIEVRRWSRAGYFNGDFCFSTGWNRGGEPTGSISVQTTRDSAVLSYRIKDFSTDQWQDKRQLVPVVQTPCNYGGYRRWFLCPACDRQCELLYLRSARFACRLCQRVAYASQSGGAVDRLMHKAFKLQNRAGDRKPRGMRWSKYQAIFDQIGAIEESIDRLSLIRVASLLH